MSPALTTKKTRTMLWLGIWHWCMFNSWSLHQSNSSLVEILISIDPMVSLILFFFFLVTLSHCPFGLCIFAFSRISFYPTSCILVLHWYMLASSYCMWCLSILNSLFCFVIFSLFSSILLPADPIDFPPFIMLIFWLKSGS